MRLHRSLAFSLVLFGCNSSPEKPSETPPPARNDRPGFAEIQRYEDTRDPDRRLSEFLADPDAGIRRRALVAMGRVGNPADVPAVAARITDVDAKVAEEAVYALGQIGGPTIRAELTPLLADPEPEMRALALEALSRAKNPADLGLAVKLVGDRSARVRGEVALATGRMSKAAEEADKPRALEAVKALAPLLRDPDGNVRWRTAFAISRVDAEPLAAELKTATVDQDPLVRTFATRALGKIAGVPADPFIRASADPDPRVAWEGVAALASREGDAVVAALEAAASGGEAIKVARAMELLGELKRATPGTLKAASRHPDASVRAAALVAGTLQKGITGSAEAAMALTDPEPAMRRAGVRALVAVGGSRAREEIAKLFAGTEHILQLEALGAIEALAKKNIDAAKEWDPVLLAGLEVPDMAVRGTVAELLSGRKETDWDAPMESALRSSTGEGMAEIRESILAWFESVKRGADAARGALKDESWAVRKQAARTLKAANGESVDPGPEPRAAALSPTVLEEVGFSRIVRLETSRGVIRIRLLPGAAPAHCSAFVRLVRNGFYDGKSWHRVVPNFVIQGGDPRGDGWGDAGFTLRDEISREPYSAGTVGMAKGEKDTGSCQLFITSAPAPHLDGAYTVFGRVEEGMDVVRAIEVDDKILKATLE